MKTGLEWNTILQKAENCEWRKLVVKSTVVPQCSARLQDWWWWWWRCVVLYWMFCTKGQQSGCDVRYQDRKDMEGTLLDVDYNRTRCRQDLVGCWFGQDAIIIIVIELKDAIWDFFAISSLRRKLSPTCTLKWFGHNRVQITCNTQSAHHAQHVVCHLARRDNSAIKVAGV